MPVALAVLSLAVAECGPGAIGPALRSVGPAVAFLWAVMRLALLAERSGLAERLAAALLAAGRGSAMRLFWWLCAACALLTAALSLDGAVVVANAFSAALPAGNPTNLVVMNRLGLEPGAFVARMGAPALLATLVCIAAVVLLERRALSGTYELGERPAFVPGQLLPALLL